jgi:hemerythrin-like domain-containing protein
MGTRDPLEQLERCHRRMEEALARLEQAAGEPDDAADQEIVDTLAWFERTSARHVEDEELSLFPRLRERPELVDLIAALTARVYRDHIEREERDLLPAARAALADDDRAAMSAEMETRREPDGRGRDRR